MNHNKAIHTHDIFIFELDDVIFPAKDYTLQVYYLFSNFIEYSELQPSAQELLLAFKAVFDTEGEVDIYSKISAQFQLPEKYERHFYQLFDTARLPLKLLIFKPIFEYLQTLIRAQKTIYLLTDGKLETQLNKIKQLEWHDLQDYIKVYFVDEHPEKNKAYLINDILKENQKNTSNCLLIGHKKQDEYMAKALEIAYLPVQNFVL